MKLNANQEQIVSLLEYSPILCFVDDVTYFHVEGPVFTLKRAIGGSLWKSIKKEGRPKHHNYMTTVNGYLI